MTKELAQQLLERKDVYLTAEGRRLLEAIVAEMSA
jgi:DNA-binding transcriptional LysR family regulator